MKDGDKFDKANLKSTYAILFFGVPNQGMEIKSLLAMVRDQPNRYLVESLSRISEVLREQWDKFPKVFNFKDSVIISFYETEMSPTVQEVSYIEPGSKAYLMRKIYRRTVFGVELVSLPSWSTLLPRRMLGRGKLASAISRRSTGIILRW